MVDKALQDVEKISKELLDLADSGKWNKFRSNVRIFFIFNGSYIRSVVLYSTPK